MDKIENYFKDADAVLIGNGKKPISGKVFEAIKKHIKDLETETGLVIIIADFYAIYAIPMLPVTSSQIKSIGFKDNTLYVEFNKGDVYSYKDVPDGLFVNLRFAESVGKFFASEVKGKYDYVKTDKKVVEGELK
jgi:hypothetical protein